MSDVRGGAISEILAASRQAEITSDETARTAGDTQQVVARLQDEVSAVSQQMQRAFQDLAARLRETVDRTSQQLHATEWHGRSREAMVAFDEDLHRTMARFMDTSEQGMGEFRGRLTDFLAQFYGTIQGEFTTAMTDIQQRYAEASRAAASYARDLEQLDETSIRY